MKVPMTLAFLGVAHSESLEAEIRKRAAKLDACCRDLVSCHLVVELPHRHHRKGNPFSVRIAVTMPGEEFAVTREGAREELRAVIRGAFDVVLRRLHTHGDKQRHAVAGGASMS